MARYFPKTARASGLDLFKIMEKRRSIRAFKTDPVPSRIIDTIIAAGKHAPSGAHRHPWLFRVVTDDSVKKNIRKVSEIGDKEWHEKSAKGIQKWLKAKHITRTKRFLTEAPVLIAVFGDSRTPYWLESVWICIGYMSLAVVDQGLGTVVYTPGDETFLNDMLDVPGHYKPQAILPIGYPLVEPQSSPAKQTELEYLALQYRNNVVAEPNPPIISSNGGKELSQDFSGQSETADLRRTAFDPDPENNKCACGCGKKLVRLNSKRKYIQGHAKFGVNGLHKVLKTPPLCRCGCKQPTDWNWESMVWKKYRDAHIGLRGYSKKRPGNKALQYNIFKD